MPRLIVQRSGRRKIPPCGRLIEYREPHSPFQKLIDSQRRRYGLSGRDLADRIGVAQSSLWIWLHNVNGYPHPKSFKHQHLQRLSRVLKIPEAKIRSSLDASRHLFTPRENPTPQEPFDALGRFIEILENDKRQTVSKSYVLNIAKNLYRGSKVTLLVLAAALFFVVGAVAGEPETLVMTSGHRFEEARVTEVTPAIITIVHSCGVARMWLSEFPADVQKKYGYDEAKARAWLPQIAAQHATAAENKRESDAIKRVQAEKMYRDVLEQAQVLSNAVYDASTKRWYRSREEAEAAREQALKDALTAKATRPR